VPAQRPSDAEGSPRITRTATQARQGEIILGPRARWVWIIAFALLIVLGIYLSSGI
jgi:hypothetical protein